MTRRSQTVNATARANASEGLSPFYTADTIEFKRPGVPRGDRGWPGSGGPRRRPGHLTPGKRN